MKQKIERYRRFHGYDYSRGAVLFITVSTRPRRAWFGQVRAARVELNALGRAVESALKVAAAHTPGVTLHEHVVMPDHVHLRVYLAPGLPQPLVTLGSFVRRFKTWTTRIKTAGLQETAGLEAGYQDGGATTQRAVLAQHPDSRPPAGALPLAGALWEPGYHDYICVSRAFIAGVNAYIGYNPLKWELMHAQKGALKVVEPLCSELLPAAYYWKGVGRVDLLDGTHRLLAVRISRRVATGDVPRLVARLLQGAAKGWVVMSTFLSPGERALHAELARRGHAFIHVKSTKLPITYRPTIAETPLFAARRLLVLGRQTEADAVTRAECLALNAALVQMAEASGGCAFYAQ